MNLTIENFKKELINKSITGIALDIDETLANTRKHWFEYLNQILGNIENLSVDELLEKYRYTGDVPSWQTQEGKIAREKLNNDEKKIEKISLMHGSQEAIRDIQKIVPILCYVTGRPESMWKVTESWLSKHGFPQIPIFYKPQEVTKENSYRWKSEVLKQLYPNILGIIDDNPIQARDLIECGYKGTMWLFDYKDHKNEFGGEIIVCKNWDEVIKSITSDVSSRLQ